MKPKQILRVLSTLAALAVATAPAMESSAFAKPPQKTSNSENRTKQNKDKARVEGTKKAEARRELTGAVPATRTGIDTDRETTAGPSPRSAVAPEETNMPTASARAGGIVQTALTETFYRRISERGRSMRQRPANDSRAARRMAPGGVPVAGEGR